MIKTILAGIILGLAIGIGYYIYLFFPRTPTFQPPEKTDYDIIIVGTGLAGLTAGIEANFISNKNFKILLLEKEPKYGGNSKKATSGINILNSPIQELNNAHDSYDIFYNDTIKSGKGRSNPMLVSTLVKDSHYIYDFFKHYNADLSKLGILGGHSIPRTHRPANITVGFHLVSTLHNYILESIKSDPKSSFKLITNATVTNLIYDKKSNTVKGVSYLKDNIENKLTSKAVILATGGYAHDFSNDPNYYSLLKKYVPSLLKYPTTNGPHSKGEGVKMAEKIGAALTDMDQVQIHPTGFVDPNDRFNKLKFLAPELIRGVGAILINQKGERFCNELGPRDYVTQKLRENCEKIENENVEQYEAYLLLNQEGVDEYGKNLLFYIQKGFLKSFDNFKLFANEYKIDMENLEKTITSYNKNVNGEKDEFGKILFSKKFDLQSKIYVATVTPSLHYTMGGLKIDVDGRVFNKDNNIIKGLYGAGEVTGGVHGGNRLGGNSLLECAVFGRRSARAAVEYAVSLI